MTETSALSTTVVMRSYDLLTDEWQSWPTLKEQGAVYSYLNELRFHWHMVDRRDVTVGGYAVPGGQRKFERAHAYFRRGNGDTITEHLTYYEDKDYE